jgi:NAD(P)-dependent dehydrogenase (short-subunit alcohol dehydrogenase family)
MKFPFEYFITMQVSIPAPLTELVFSFKLRYSMNREAGLDIDLNGKIILVTGATNGIGRVTACELARLGAQVILLSRNAEKCARVAEEIKRDTGKSVEYLAADLSTLEGIARAAEAFKQRQRRLDVLVNNAGGVFIRRSVTADDLEMTFALNHLAYFLLTGLLLDVLKQSSPARVVNVSSGLHMRAHLDFDDLQNAKRYSGFQAYGRSKLANVLFTYELARRLAGSGVTVNCLHPGYVNTGLSLNNGPIYGVFAGLSARLFGRRPEEGARTSIYLAASPEVEGVTGKYFADCQPVSSSPESYDKEVAARLWHDSLEICKKVM